MLKVDVCKNVSIHTCSLDVSMQSWRTDTHCKTQPQHMQLAAYSQGLCRLHTKSHSRACRDWLQITLSVCKITNWLAWFNSKDWFYLKTLPSSPVCCAEMSAAVHKEACLVSLHHPLGCSHRQSLPKQAQVEQRLHAQVQILETGITTGT